ncbi:MAG TPA: hypothetical protein VJL27_02735 [Patescibacteria group bacterium]|nr:hypothetical protein [Patescibacteria group bacterium]
MPAKRISKTQKILDVIDAAIDEFGILFLSYPELRRRLHGRWESNLPQAIDNLKRRGYLEVVEVDNKKALKLTIKGKLKTFIRRKSHEWDGRWRLVAFDIEEKRRSTRDVFRSNLRLLGFKPMQKSLWISPYDVSEEIEELLDLLNLRVNVDYFIADAITNKDKFLELFKLNQ